MLKTLNNFVVSSYGWWLFFDQVLMKDIVTPVGQEEVRNAIKKCLENAALVNYTKVSEATKIEGRTWSYEPWMCHQLIYAVTVLIRT